MPDLETLLSRRSVSPALLGDPAPTDADLELMLSAALRAPDHGRLEPWSFAIVRGAARARLGEVFAAALLARDPTATEPLLERERGRPQRAPLVIALGARIRTGHKIPEVEQLLAVGAAAMNILNAAHALGYGAMWTTGPNTYDPMVAEALGFAAPDRLAGFIHVGTPRIDSVAPPRPSPAAHAVEWTGPIGARVASAA
ncbi:MAG: nitroreductase [Alphaproteobacteria bacterium]|nr:nitroreductase [Alphaproteobacteria bacterium]